MVKQTELQTSSPSDREDFKFKGVRKRKWGKWVSEVRLPNSRERIWLGSYDSAEKAARAFDAAQFCLRGRAAKFNFPDTPPDIAGGRLLTPGEIQAAASRFANSATSSSSTSLSHPPRSHSESDLHMDQSPSPSASEGTVLMDSDLCLDALDSSSKWDLNYSYSYESYDNINCNMDPGQYSGSGYYPTEYGLYSGFDGLSTDFYTPAMPPVDHLEDNYDDSLNQGSFLWNF